MALYAMFSSVDGSALLVLVDPTAARERVDVPMRTVEKLWGEVYALRLQELERAEGGVDERFIPRKELSLTMRTVSAMEGAERALNAALRDYRESRHGPTMVVLQTASNTTMLTEKM